MTLRKTERLIRSPEFRRLHRRIVGALGGIEVGSLSGDDLARCLEAP